MEKRYTGTDVDVTFDGPRCIHARECVTRLHAVFDRDRRPWVLPDGAEADQVVDVVSRCPSGALHSFRHDGGISEIALEINTVRLWKDGPLQFSGDLEIAGHEGSLAEIRATLCRCGGSGNKPFCDNTHKQNGFEAADPAPASTLVIAGIGGKLKITPQRNGPIRVEGYFEIRDAQGDLIFAGEKASLCRCGGSGNKPFCDGTHVENGFEAE